MLAKHVSQILGADHFEHRKPYMDIALMGNKVQFNMTFKHQNLGMRNTEQIYHPDIAPDGEVKGFLAIVYDVIVQ